MIEHACSMWVIIIIIDKFLECSLIQMCSSAFLKLNVIGKISISEFYAAWEVTGLP